MSKQTQAKRERVIEAVRQGLEGDAAVEFVRQSGYAMTQTGIARHLRSMGGRGNVQELIESGHSNIEILHLKFPEAEIDDIRAEPPSQPELFEGEAAVLGPVRPAARGRALYETAKMSIKVPADLYEAIRLASKAEQKSQNQLVVEILTTALSQMPHLPEQSGTGPWPQ